MRSVIEKLPDALLVVEDGAVTLANELAHRLLGAASGQLVGTPLSRWLPEAERARVATVLSQRASTFEDLPETFRLTFTRAGGDAVTVDAHFRLDGGAIIYQLRDATSSVRAEALMSRLARVSGGGRALEGAEALLDAAEPIFLQLGWRGAWTRIVPEGSVTLRSLACPPGDPVGEYAATLVGRVVPRSATPVLQQVVSGDQAVFLDNVPTFLSGPPKAAAQLSKSLVEGHVYRSAWCPVRNPQGRITHLLAMAGRDLSERDFVALQLFAAELGEANELARLQGALVKAERLAAVGEMAAVLAHEIRNPLGVVFNAAYALKRTVSGDANLALLDALLEEAERLRGLTADLVDFARPTAPQLKPVELGPLLVDVVAASGAAHRGDVQVALEVPQSVQPVAVDEPLLRRVLANLLANALQHVTPGGRVTIAVQDTADEVQVRVANDGEPVPRELEERIFEPFFTTRAAGAGLGLAVVKKLVGELGGRVALEPRDDGAAFRVSLPHARPGEA